MRILALDPGTKRIGVAVSDELKMIATPLEYIPAEPLAGFLDRLKELLREKEVELILVGMQDNPRSSETVRLLFPSPVGRERGQG